MVQKKQNDIYRKTISAVGKMKADAVVFADQDTFQAIEQDGALKQLCSVACLPGIIGPALAMPDAHQGYGFPIGGVAAFDMDEGIISPGGVGYDINCGVRLFRTNLTKNDFTSSKISNLANALFAAIPAGPRPGGGLKLDKKELNRVLIQGAKWSLKQGMGEFSDVEFSESQGVIELADYSFVSPKALKRGISQLGTLGGGNHFVEVAYVDELDDPKAGQVLGLEKDQIVIWIHSGSRGLGHQVCDDYLRLLANNKDAIHQKDRQLVSAPIQSKIGKQYMGALASAANFAFANRQILSWRLRQAMEKCTGLGPRDLGISLIYDVAHNIAKVETHLVKNKPLNVLVHRKGATRALGPGHRDLPDRYKSIGQPVLLPGDMARASYLLLGTNKAELKTFASSAHGAGRSLSRTQARKLAKGRNLGQELKKQGVTVLAENMKTLAEEMPSAYKDVLKVADILDGAKIARKVMRSKPLIVIKG